MKVIDKIHPKDPMYNKEYPERYGIAGTQAINVIKSALSLGNKNYNEIKNILDFPSGYGRILRYLQSAFENSTIYAGDIDPDMVNFCKETFGALPLISKENFENISFPQKFDLIWCGSLFTHIDKTIWNSLLQLFFSSLENNGILVFTFHGRKIISDISAGKQNFGFDDVQISHLLEDYQKNAFGFLPRKEGKNYGISISSPSFVVKLIDKIPSMKLLLYSEFAWLEHDVIAIMKDSKSKAIEK